MEDLCLWRRFVLHDAPPDKCANNHTPSTGLSGTAPPDSERMLISCAQPAIFHTAGHPAGLV